MFGFIIGTLCLFALFGTIRRRRYGYYRGWGMPYYARGGFGPGFHHYGHHHHGYGGGHGGRYGRLRYAFERLDTTPGQEKAIVNAMQGLRESMRTVRDGIFEPRKDLAAAIEAEGFDRTRVEAALGRSTGAIEEGRGALVQALANIHAALDERQRKLLADFISTGSFGRSWAGGC